MPVCSTLGEDTTGDNLVGVSPFTENNHMNKDENWDVALDWLIVSVEGIDTDYQVIGEKNYRLLNSEWKGFLKYYQDLHTYFVYCSVHGPAQFLYFVDVSGRTSFIVRGVDRALLGFLKVPKLL